MMKFFKLRPIDQFRLFSDGWLAKLLLVLAVIIPSFAIAAESAGSDPNKDDEFYGNYQVDGNYMGIDHFIMDNGEKVALISDYASGVVRRLFPVNENETEFVMGPGFHTPNPAELTVRLIKDQHGVTTGLRLHREDGTESLATRVPLRKEQVFFEQADARLSGTLIMPQSKGPHPAIILLHGSGPLTRYSFGPYPHFFSSLGLAVLIFDKRGTGESTGLRMDASTGTVMKPAYYPEDLANDALSALHFLQQRKDVDPKRIGLWGSSEGGMLATYVASKSKDVAFAINSSGFMEPLWKILDYQIEPLLRDAKVPEDVIQRQLAFVDLWLEVASTGKGWEKFKKQEAELIKADGFSFFQSRGEYKSLEEMRWDWNHVLTFNPQDALGKVTCPVLGLFGERDTITPAFRTAENMRRVLAEAKHKDFTVKIFPNAGHSLSEVPEKKRMAPGVFDTLSTWIGERVYSQASASQSSPYAGEESREIKALSPSEVEGLLSGKGMGYAKAAELNGYPGPVHVLALKEELSLTEDQQRETEAIFSKMEAAAKELGAKLVAAERALNEAFKSKKIDEPSLSELVKNIGDIESRLRAAHLSAHLQQTKILSEQQIAKYIALRGYVDGGHGSHHKHHLGE